MPRRHRPGLTNVRRFHVPTETGTIEPMLAAFFAQVSRVCQQGDDWRDVIDSMRPATPQLWKALKLEEKERFLAEYQRFWDVHRFRMAPEVADRYDALVAAGRLETGAASIVSLESHGRGARVFLRTPGAHELDMVEVDRIVDCYGRGLRPPPAGAADPRGPARRRPRPRR